MSPLARRGDCGLLEAMKTACLWLGLLLGTPLFSLAQVEENYPTPPESIQQEGVPAGTVKKGVFAESRVFPGTTREYAVYIPAQYDGTQPAALMVFQDGLGYLGNVPVTFDNLIHAGDMPVTIGLFINPGVVPETREDALARYNRSYEYDSVDGRYARFLIEEMMPHALNGLKISTDPNWRAITGSSSGGIAAFQVAWKRPDQFRRVFTTVGTYVGLRGGNELPVLVRKTEPKPLRVFLQDGRNDLNIYCGSWWVANQDMLASLEWAGYEVEHAWGEGAHNRKHGNAIFPEVMKWLWQEWKGDGAEVRTHPDRSKSKANDFLVEGAGWELLSEGHDSIGGIALNAQGELFFSDESQGLIWKIGAEGRAERFQEGVGAVRGLAFGPDGLSLHVAVADPGHIVSWQVDTGEKKVLAEAKQPRDLVVAHDGTVYWSEPETRTLHLWTAQGGARLASDEAAHVHGITLSPDQSLVYVSDYHGRFVWSGQRQDDGTLAYMQPYYHLHIPAASVEVRSLSQGMAVDRAGWLLVATAMGVQICDQPGRVHLIVPGPQGAEPPSQLALHEKTLYASCGGRLYRRQVQLEEARAWAAPTKPEKPRL